MYPSGKEAQDSVFKAKAKLEMIGQTSVSHIKVY